MQEPASSTPLGRSRIRVVHASLLASLILFAAITLYLSGRAAESSTPDGGSLVMKVMGFAVLVAGIVAVMLFRGRISPRRTDTDLDEWWPTNYPYAVLMWALAEGSGLFGVTAGWVTQDKTLHIAGVVVGVLLLIWCRPGSLAARRRFTEFGSKGQIELADA